MQLSSLVFQDGGFIPCKYTCHGKGINPELKISGTPHGARSLTLILEDMDVPSSFQKGDSWVHWLVWNIDPRSQKLRENEKFLGAVEGRNTSGHIGYEGPCPPLREREYHFRLFALDKRLCLDRGSGKQDLVCAMNGHVIEIAQLVGRYKNMYGEFV